MLKRIIGWLLVLALLLPCAATAEGDRRVYRVDEEGAMPFAEDAETFDLYVCPLMGADCMILMTQGQTMMVDFGRNTDYGTIRGILDDLGITKIDIAFNSHPHDDHLGSMIQLLEDYAVGVFMTAFPENYFGKSVIQISTIRALHDAEVPVQMVSDGDTFTFGDVRMTVFRMDRFDSPNLLSAMLKIEYGECSMLLTGDVTGEAQFSMVKHHDLKADILKFPHHGLNRTASDFMAAIDPEYAFLTHGYSNTKEAQKQLTRLGIFHDFATWGVIHLSCNGEYWLVDQALTEDGQRYAEKYR